MQYLALYIVLLAFIILAFARGKNALFNIIIMAYPTMIIYKAILESGGEKIIQDAGIGLSDFTTHLILFLIVLYPVYVSLIRIVDNFKIKHSLKGMMESIILSVGIVLLTIGVCFHVLPDKDVFNLANPLEDFFQSAMGYLICVVVPMISVYVLSKKPKPSYSNYLPKY